MARDRALRLTRLRLTNWRNFRSAEVDLAQRAFFVGPNASGKSNLLDAIRFLRDLVKPVGGGFASALDERGGLTAVRCLHATGTVNYVEIGCDVGSDAEPRTWSYVLRFGQPKRIKKPIILREAVFHNGSLTYESAFDPGASDPEVFTQSSIQQISSNTSFRELASFFSSIRYLHVVPQIVRDPRRSLDRQEDFFGGDLLARVRDTRKSTREARLSRISEALEIAVPQFQNLRLQDDAQGRPHLVAEFRHWRKTPSYQTEASFSDGTLRLIGFLWALAEKEGPLLLEEPELSLHADVARQLPSLIHRMQRLSGRQVLMTTHSDAIVGADGVGLDEVHILQVGDNGTTIETARDKPIVVKQVEAGMTVDEAVMPLARPRDVQQLSFIDVL